MEVFGRVFDWIGTNESVLSGIAATIVILGVLYAPIHRFLARRRFGQGARGENDKPGEAASESPSPKLLTPDGPSIAVMPFSNLSADEEQEFLADGLTEDIILGLSRVKQLFVIARNTCFTYKGKTPDTQQVASELGIRYVLEGSIRRRGDRIRVTAQLVDAATRTLSWSEQFDRPVEEIVDVDDEVTTAIVGALLPALRRAEAELARRAAPEDLTAWALVNRAWVTLQRDLGDIAAAEEAIAACEEALHLDADYAMGHAVLGYARSLLVHQPVRVDAERRIDEDEMAGAALASIRRALELGADDPLVHHCHAALLGNLGRTRDAVRAWGRAMELDPNSAGARAGLGIAMIYMKKADESLPLIESALRRSPADPLQGHWLSNRAFAQMLTGQVSDALESARAAHEQGPSRLGFAVLAMAYALSGQLDEFAQAWSDLAERFPVLHADDVGRFAARLAIDSDWGDKVHLALCEAAESTTPPS